jgi:hypothetical protein
MAAVAVGGHARAGGRSGARMPDLEPVLAVIEGEAAAGARRGQLPNTVLDALRQAGLLKLYLPADLGGHGMTLPDACPLIARVGAAPAGPVMIGAGPNWFAGAMPPPLAREIFHPAESAVAGAGAPGRALRAPGGWRVDGSWRWCSGAPWATRFTFGVREAGEASGDRDDLNAGNEADAFVVAVPAATVCLNPESRDVRGHRPPPAGTPTSTASSCRRRTCSGSRADRPSGPSPSSPCRSSPSRRRRWPPGRWGSADAWSPSSSPSPAPSPHHGDARARRAASIFLCGTPSVCRTQ